MQYTHGAIRTADIHRAIAFYQALGFEITTRFTADITLACWMDGAGTRIELIQIPEPKPAPDCFYDQHYVGYYHFSFTVEDLEQELKMLVEKLGRVKLLLSPIKQEIGDRTYLIAFIADPDGLPIELMQLLPTAVV
jgi:catechol 2,3-dioxygenase-like lactoylglutathione lyase family enzyme